MEAVDVRGRFVWHQLMTRDVPGRQEVLLEAHGLESAALAARSHLHGLSRGRRAGGRHHGDSRRIFPPKCRRTGCSTSARVTSMAPRTRRCAPAAPSSRRPATCKGAGRYAVLKDPQGALFAIIDPENARAEYAGMPPLGAFSWHELATSDNEAAFAFYSGLFGWDAITRMDMGPTGHLPGLRHERCSARRHVHQAAGLAGAAELAAVRAMCPVSMTARRELRERAARRS